MILVTDKVARDRSLSRTTFLKGLLLVILTLVAYAPAMRGSFIWDDDDYVTHNPTLRSVEGLREIWLVPRSLPQYYPLVHTTFWIEHQLWDDHAAGYHVVNILLQAIATTLFWRLLVMLEIPAALLAAGIFAIHPVQAESVAWITERKNVLCGVFYFTSALAFVAWGHLPLCGNPRPSENKPSWKLYVFSLVLFACAMLSKTVACSLPAALALVLWWKQARLSRRQWQALIPMLAIALPLALCTAHLEVAHVQAVGREWDYSLLQRVLIAGRGVWFYVTKFVLPFHLSFIYPKWWPIDPGQAWQWAFPVGVAVGLVALFLMRSRWGRGPLVAALIFVGTLMPALGFFNIYPMRYSFVADHFQYLACAALCVLLAIALLRVFRQFAYLVLVLLLVLTMARSYVLADPLRLWQDTVAKNPDSWMVHLNVAKTLVERGDEPAAEHEFEQQVALAPELPETHWNMGVNYSRRGKFDAALAELDRAIAIDPTFPQAYYARGRVYLQQNQLDRAEADLRHAIKLKPDFAQAQNELGELLMRQRQFAEAVEHFRAAIAADANLAAPHFNLAAILAASGDLEAARAQFEQAVQINPALAQYRDRIFGHAR